MRCSLAKSAATTNGRAAQGCDGATTRDELVGEDRQIAHAAILRAVVDDRRVDLAGEQLGERTLAGIRRQADLDVR